MDRPKETTLRTIAQLQEFLKATREVSVKRKKDDSPTYLHISRESKRFEYLSELSG